MRRMILATLAAAVLVVGGGVATAQSANFFFNSQQDFPLPSNGPCDASTQVEDADPFVYDGHVWVLYTCSPNVSLAIPRTVWARKFPGSVESKAVVYSAPAPSTPTPTPTPTSSCPTIQPGPNWVCVNGNWLPPQ
jgi:hypothetical protein